MESEVWDSVAVFLCDYVLGRYFRVIFERDVVVIKNSHSFSKSCQFTRLFKVELAGKCNKCRFRLYFYLELADKSKSCQFKSNLWSELADKNQDVLTLCIFSPWVSSKHKTVLTQHNFRAWVSTAHHFSNIYINKYRTNPNIAKHNKMTPLPIPVIVLLPTSNFLASHGEMTAMIIMIAANTYKLRSSKTSTRKIKWMPTKRPIHGAT